MKKQTLLLRSAGLLLTSLPILLSNTGVSDLSKGLVSGIGIGFLILSIIIPTKQKSAI